MFRYLMKSKIHRATVTEADLHYVGSITIDRDLIGKKARLSVNARIEQQGKLRFISDKAYPPLKDGQPVPVDIVLKPAGRTPR